MFQATWQISRGPWAHILEKAKNAPMRSRIGDCSLNCVHICVHIQIGPLFHGPDGQDLPEYPFEVTIAERVATSAVRAQSR